MTADEEQKETGNCMTAERENKRHIRKSAYVPFRGPDRIRTDDPYNANVVRSQLRYKPISSGIFPTRIL